MSSDLEAGRRLRLVAPERRRTELRTLDAADERLDAAGLDPLDAPAPRYRPRHGRRVCEACS